MVSNLPDGCTAADIDNLGADDAQIDCPICGAPDTGGDDYAPCCSHPCEMIADAVGRVERVIAGGTLTVRDSQDLSYAVSEIERAMEERNG
jgi:hypothetical protein